MATLNEIKNQKKIERAIHSLKAWKAAFRLLQGAAIEGHIGKTKFIELVSNQINADELAEDKKVFLDKISEEILNGILSKSKTGTQKFSKPNPGAMKLILVDDEAITNGWEDVLNIITGNECKVYKSQTEYFEAIKNDKEIFDDVVGVLIDLKLPVSEKTGLAIIRYMSNNFPHIPVVAFSASTSVAYIKQAFENGIWDYFIKDPNENEFKDPAIYYQSFCKLLNRLVQYDKNYTSKYWNQIIELENKLVNRKYYDVQLQKSITDKLKIAYKYLIIDEVNRFAPDFLQINKAEQISNLSGQALETFCNMYLFKTGIINDEKGISLNDKIKMMNVFSNNQKTKAQDIRMLRNDGIHHEKVDFKTKRLIAKRKISINDAEMALSTTIKLCDVTFTKLTTP
jgi:response regulator of citrate/malate metabolism